MSESDEKFYAALHAHLSEQKATSLPPCPLCAAEDWSIEAALYSIPQRDAMNSGPFEVLPVICDSCGYVMFLSAKVAKLTD